VFSVCAVWRHGIIESNRVRDLEDSGNIQTRDGWLPMIQKDALRNDNPINTKFKIVLILY